MDQETKNESSPLSADLRLRSEPRNNDGAKQIELGSKGLDSLEHQLSDCFEQVVTMIRQNADDPTDKIPSSSLKLRLYGLYKHVRCGTCNGKEKPSVLQLTASAKYKAWNACRGLTREEAMQRYINLIASQKDTVLGRKVAELVPSSKPSNVTTDPDSESGDHSTTGSMPRKFPLGEYLGVKPLIPRGQLDISYKDLLHAGSSCLSTPVSRKSDCSRYCQQIATMWKEATSFDHVLTGLSLRTLLDLYLRSRRFPAGSQIILSPPISVPGVERVLLHHGIEIVPVDLPKESTMSVDCQGCESVLTEKTVAIMVVHVFGAICATETQMKQLRATCDRRKLDLLEDCAQSFSGLVPESYLGSPYADVVLFSFGLIKTGTAIGGGIALVRSKPLFEVMERIHSVRYELQSTPDYVWSLVRALFLKVVGDNPLLCGLVAMILSVLGLDYEKAATSLVRGFSAGSSRSLKGCIGGIRKAPSHAMLSLLLKRLKQSRQSRSLVMSRRREWDRLVGAIEGRKGILLPHFPSGECHTYWLFPVICSDAQGACRHLRQLGVDATQGSSQMRTMGHSSWHCRNAASLMEQVVYVPTSRTSVALEALGTYTPGSTPVEPTTVPTSFIWYAVFTVPVVFAFPFSALLLAVSVLCFSYYTLAYLLTVFVAPRYLTASSTFAKYNYILSEKYSGQIAVSHGDDQGQPSDAPPERERELCRSVILTGATGFIGCSLMYEFLRNREILGINRLYLIVRPKKGKSSKERVAEILRRPIFSLLGSEWSSNVIVLDGDTSKEHAGLSSADLERIIPDPTISHVIHCAASVGFTQTLREAATANISSALSLQALTGKLSNQNAQFVHMSTAFVHGGLTGSKDDPLPESLFSIAPYDPVEVYKSMLGTEFYAAKAMSDLSFPNTYAFSKCVAEHLLRRRNINTVVVRPSIVGPALACPVPGWSGEKPSTITAAPSLYFSYQFNVWAFGSHKVPCIPVDVLSNFIVTRLLSVEETATDTDSSVSSEEGFLEVKSSVAVKVKPTGDSFQVLTAAWNPSSEESLFTWSDYVAAITQSGSVLGYFSRPVVYLGLAVSTYLMPQTTKERFEHVHSFFVQRPIDLLLILRRFAGLDNSLISRLKQYLDLPVLFYHFMNNSFYFDSCLPVPSNFRSHAYQMTCIRVAHTFLSRSRNRQLGSGQNGKVEALPIGGRECYRPIGDMTWCTTQPTGSIASKMSAFVLTNILRATFESVTVDVTSFCSALRAAESHPGPVRLIIAPTHRSFFDFLLVSYAIFSLPELQMPLPYIVAASDFQKLPIIGHMCKILGAVFINRGRGLGARDPSLAAAISNLPLDACIEVFFEGTRSRDRRFVMPKTGVLRCVQSLGVDCLIVPISISYERVPEQASLLQEAASGSSKGLTTKGILSWLYDVSSGSINFGRAHIVASSPVEVLSKQTDQDKTYLFDCIDEIQRRQTETTVLSQYHVEAIATLTGTKAQVVLEALRTMGCNMWPVAGNATEKCEHVSPKVRDECWAAALQAGPWLAPAFVDSRPAWSNWLHRLCCKSAPPSVMANNSVKTVIMALTGMFDDSSKETREARAQLVSLGFKTPSTDHIVQIALKRSSKPMLLLRAAAEIQFSSTGKLRNVSDTESPSALLQSEKMEPLGAWGHADSRFVLRTNGGKPYVTMQGDRYPLCNTRLTKLVPFIECETGISIDPILDELPDMSRCCASSPSALSRIDLERLANVVEKLSTETSERLCHGSGQSQADVCALRFGSVLRSPDVVVWPAAEDQVIQLIKLARSRQWCLIPFGGGTNVSQATLCPPLDVEPRPIISVDMRLMNQIISVDEVNGVAHVQAGITGQALAEAMDRLGYSIGHEPDSYEFSTLGGWVATKSSGMKRSKYGNIEDIVTAVRVAGPSGIQSHGDGMWGRESCGLDLCDLLLGSEGCLGIIISATVRIWQTPAVTDFDSILFPDFETGVSFCRKVSELASAPASVRLLDNKHFRMGLAMRPENTSLQSLVHSVQDVYMRWNCASDFSRCVCVTLLFEGSSGEVRQQQRHLRSIISTFQGTSLGSKAGRSGYNMTLVIAYLRDFALSYRFIGESFESFVPWSKIHTVVAATQACVEKEHESRLLPGKPFFCYRVTQLYHEGVCIYFYLSMSIKSVEEPSTVFTAIEHAARKEILLQGGSLSHHHGIGKLRASFLKQTDSSPLLEAKRAVKRAIDPDNVFGARNGAYM